MARALDQQGTLSISVNGHQTGPEHLDAADLEQPIDPQLAPPDGYWKKEEEHFIAPVSPMFFSIHHENIRDATRAAFGDFGLLIDHLELTYRAGEVYERDQPVGGDSGPPPPWWVLAAMCRIIPSLRARMNQAEQAVRTDLEAQIFQRWSTEWKSELEQTSSAIRSVDVACLDNRDLAQHLKTIRDLTHRAFYIHFQIGVANLLPVYRLVRLCHDLFGWDEHQALQLLHGSSTESSVGSRDLDRISGLIQQDSTACAYLMDPSCELSDFESVHPGIGAEIRAHLDTYGYRMIQNDVMSPTFIEVPAVTLQLLRDRIQKNASARSGQVEHTRSQAEEKATELMRMRSAAERARFEHTLSRAREGYRLREENVYLTLGHPFALLRFAILEAGNRLEREGHLHRTSDVFYGMFDEIHDALLGNGTRMLAENARRRRLEARWTLEHPGPAMFGTEDPPPDIRGLPQPSRELHEALIWATRRLRAPNASENASISGVPASPGTYRGTARVIRSEQDFHRLQPGDVLVCPSTSSSWAVLFGTCAALVTDQGGSLSHPAIIAREHGIPAVVATVTATQEIPDGQTILVDGTNGLVELIAEQGR
jgi:rifampicin phosphotransferase